MDAAEDTEESRREIGWSARPADQAIAYADPRPPEDRPAGEDEMGVPIFQHPEMALTWAHMGFAATVDRFRVGARRKILPRDWARLSNLELEAILTLAGADQRARLAEMRREIDDNSKRQRSGATRRQ